VFDAETAVSTAHGTGTLPTLPITRDEWEIIPALTMKRALSGLRTCL